MRKHFGMNEDIQAFYVHYVQQTLESQRKHWRWKGWGGREDLMTEGWERGNY